MLLMQPAYPDIWIVGAMNISYFVAHWKDDWYMAPVSHMEILAFRLVIFLSLLLLEIAIMCKRSLTVTRESRDLVKRGAY